MPEQSFKEFVLDQLSLLPEVCARAMFGGYGLYQGEHFFAIILEGRLYFRTDEDSRADFEARGMGPFVYAKSGKTISMRYFEVPSEILEHRFDLACWARRAINTGGYGRKAKKRQSGARRTAVRPKSNRRSRRESPRD